MTSSKSGLKLSVPIQTGFLEKFDTLETLGQGTFGIVKKCRDKQTKDEFAVKIIRSRVLSSRIENETQICSQLKHPHIVRLHNVFQDDIQYYMIFDLVTGGELFEDIVKREYYSESEASKCIQQILDAVAYCHDKNIIHR
ncbi:Serine threonine protein kinase-related domain containing protein [Oopsacas minuta]|uniref:Serine threonine protein kinase-related domain containing protein n=1 Tax=Oopsacas minuta TaxID=111878 RepID=A0AAV7JLL9_9METZ|nr:Serine threonine protein kinase-related domain containing protein [Oopsacas minuta]